MVDLVDAADRRTLRGRAQLPPLPLSFRARLRRGPVTSSADGATFVYVIAVGPRWPAVPPAVAPRFAMTLFAAEDAARYVGDGFDPGADDGGEGDEEGAAGIWTLDIDRGDGMRALSMARTDAARGAALVDRPLLTLKARVGSGVGARDPELHAVLPPADMLAATAARPARA